MELFRQRAILLCFAYFCVLTIGTIGITTFLGTSLNAAYGLPLAIAATAITAYLLGSAAGMLAGGFLAARTARHDRVAATGLGGRRRADAVARAVRAAGDMGDSACSR